MVKSRTRKETEVKPMSAYKISISVLFRPLTVHRAMIGRSQTLRRMTYKYSEWSWPIDVLYK